MISKHLKGQAAKVSSLTERDKQARKNWVWGRRGAGEGVIRELIRGCFALSSACSLEAVLEGLDAGSVTSSAGYLLHWMHFLIAK